MQGALPVEFYDRDTIEVARDLLGKSLFGHDAEGRVVGGRIVETEAYLPEGDPACHAARGRTPRNASMFGPPGRAYVYAIHSRWCLNTVTCAEGVPTAVLIRAVEPVAGIELMQSRRGQVADRDLARGPARLCEAFAIDRRQDGIDITTGEQVWIANGNDAVITSDDIGCSPRIGVTSAEDLPLRFFVDGSRYVSGPRKHHRR